MGDYWRAQVCVKGHPSLSRTFDSWAEAQTWARDVRRQMERGLYRSMAEAERTALIRAWTGTTGKSDLARATPPRNCNGFGNGSAIPLFLALRGQDFAKYRDVRRAAGRAENTIRLELQVVSHLFAICLKERALAGGAPSSWHPRGAGRQSPCIA